MKGYYRMMSDTAATTAAALPVEMPTEPAWMAQALAQSVLARELYDVEYRSDYAWQESNDSRSEVEVRRAAYARYSELDARLWRAISALRQIDPFLCREVMTAASDRAFRDYDAARAKQ